MYDDIYQDKMVQYGGWGVVRGGESKDFVYRVAWLPLSRRCKWILPAVL